MKQKTAVSTFLVSLWAASLLVLPCQASVVMVEDVQFSFGQTLFYSGSDQTFTFDYPAVNGILKVPSGSGYQYSIENAVVSFQDSALLADNTVAGGLANGTFTGGIDLTVTGRLVKTDTDAEYADGVLITATMDDMQWTIQETSSFSGISQVAGLATFTTTGGVLFDGQGPAELDILRLYEFDLGFFATAMNVTEFGQDDIVATAATVQMQIPEPATVGLLSLGMLSVGLFRKDRSKKV